MGLHSEATAFYERALCLNPNNFEVLKQKGDAYYSLKKYEEAIAAYN